MEVASKIFFFIKMGSRSWAKPPVQERSGGFDSDFLKNPIISISLEVARYLVLRIAKLWRGRGGQGILIINWSLAFKAVIRPVHKHSVLQVQRIYSESEDSLQELYLRLRLRPLPLNLPRSTELDLRAFLKSLLALRTNAAGNSFIVLSINSLFLKSL